MSRVYRFSVDSFYPLGVGADGSFGSQRSEIRFSWGSSHLGSSHGGVVRTIPFLEGKSMKGFSGKLTPCAIVALFSPILFVVAPDGMPFVHAVCESTSGTVTNTGIPIQRGCSPLTGSVDQVSAVSATQTTNEYICEMTLSVTFTIFTSDGCTVNFAAMCPDPQGQPTACDSRASYTWSGTYSDSFTGACPGDGDAMDVNLRFGANCSCSTGDSNPPTATVLVSAVGTCDA